MQGVEKHLVYAATCEGTNEAATSTARPAVTHWMATMLTWTSSGSMENLIVVPCTDIVAPQDTRVDTSRYVSRGQNIGPLQEAPEAASASAS